MRRFIVCVVVVAIGWRLWRYWCEPFYRDERYSHGG